MTEMKAFAVSPDGDPGSAREASRFKSKNSHSRIPRASSMFQGCVNHVDKSPSLLDEFVRAVRALPSPQSESLRSLRPARLTEGSAILKYLADKYDLPVYPKDLKQRAKVNEIIDWLNTQFYRDFGYGLIYPQLFPHHKRRSDEAHAGAVAWGQQGAKNWLQLLNDFWVGPNKQYLCGSQLTIADYFGAGVVSIGELIECDFSVYPNIKRWLDNMKKLKSWNHVNEVFSMASRREHGQGVCTGLTARRERTCLPRSARNFELRHSLGHLELFLRCWFRPTHASDRHTIK